MTYVVDGVWNHNVHHMPALLDAVPAGCRSALDVGCGQGFLLPGLAARSDRVVGIDRYAPALVEARERVRDLPTVEVVDGDVMTHHLPEPFDAVMCVAVLHHLPLEAGLTRMRELTTPGGVVGVVGLARSCSPRDYAVDAIGAVTTRLHRVRRRYTTVSAPMCDPAETYAEVRAAAERILPGARFRHHPLFRYTLIWTKPTN